MEFNSLNSTYLPKIKALAFAMDINEALKSEQDQIAESLGKFFQSVTKISVVISDRNSSIICYGFCFCFWGAKIKNSCWSKRSFTHSTSNWFSSRISMKMKLSMLYEISVQGHYVRRKITAQGWIFWKSYKCTVSNKSTLGSELL